MIFFIFWLLIVYFIIYAYVSKNRKNKKSKNDINNIKAVKKAFLIKCFSSIIILMISVGGVMGNIVVMISSSNEGSFDEYISSSEGMAYAETYIRDVYGTEDVQLYRLHTTDIKDGKSSHWTCSYDVNIPNGTGYDTFKISLLISKSVFTNYSKELAYDIFFQEPLKTIFDQRHNETYEKKEIKYEDSTKILPIIYEYYNLHFRSNYSQYITWEGVYFIDNMWILDLRHYNVFNSFVFFLEISYDMETKNISSGLEYYTSWSGMKRSDPSIFPPDDIYWNRGEEFENL